MIETSLPPHSYYQNTSIIKNWKNKRPEFLDINEYSYLRVVWGHSIHEQMLYFLKTPLLFTGLREPIARLKSNAKYMIDLRRRQGVPFDLATWLQSQRNPMTWFIIDRFPTLAARDNTDMTPFEKAKLALSNFDHVYFADTFDESIKVIFDALNISAPSKKVNVGVEMDIDIDIDPATLAYDLDLYDWARSYFSERVLDLKRPTSKALADFLHMKPKPVVLETFLFRSQAGEYKNWKKLDEATDDRLARAMRLLREVTQYREHAAP